MRLGLGLGLPLKRRVVISANSAPSAISISHNEATEDLAVGLAIGTLSTTDADAGDTHTYTLVSDVSGKFSISGNELVLAAPLDYETATSHSVTIRSTDSSGNSVQQAFTITVLDFNEVDTHGPLIVDTASGIVDDGGFTVGPIVGDGSGGIKIQGKNGGLAKFIYDIGPPQAGYTYTIRYDPDFTRLSNTGKEAFVGFGFKSSNDFHFTGLKGDGATGLNAYKIYGANKFNQSSGFTTVNDGAAAFGTQAGPNWLRIVIASAGTTYTLSTSSDGQNWTEEFTAATPSPLASATAAGQFGIAVFLENSDKGQFSIQVTVWTAAAAAVFDLTPYSPTAAFSFSRNLLSGYAGAKYADTGGAITTWNDQGGSARDVTDGGVSARRPTLSTAGPNSVACGDFDGANNYLSGIGLGNYWATGNKFIVISCMVDTISQNEHANFKADQNNLITASNGVAGISFAKKAGVDTVYIHNYVSGSSDTNTSATITLGTPYVFAFRHDTSTNMYLSVNGGAEVSVATNTTFQDGSETLRIGRYLFYFDGKIFEAATWGNAVPNATDRAAIVAGFMAPHQ